MILRNCEIFRKKDKNWPANDNNPVLGPCIYCYSLKLRTLNFENSKIPVGDYSLNFIWLMVTDISRFYLKIHFGSTSPRFGAQGPLDTTQWTMNNSRTFRDCEKAFLSNMLLNTWTWKIHNIVALSTRYHLRFLKATRTVPILSRLKFQFVDTML